MLHTLQLSFPYPIKTMSWLGEIDTWWAAGGIANYYQQSSNSGTLLQSGTPRKCLLIMNAGPGPGEQRRLLQHQSGGERTLEALFVLTDCNTFSLPILSKSLLRFVKKSIQHDLFSRTSQFVHPHPTCRCDSNCTVVLRMISCNN